MLLASMTGCGAGSDCVSGSDPPGDAAFGFRSESRVGVGETVPPGVIAFGLRLRRRRRLILDFEGGPDRAGSTGLDMPRFPES